MTKKAVVCIIFCLMTSVMACGKVAPVTQPEEEGSTFEESYAVLKEAVSAFETLTSGTLQVVIDSTQNHKDVSSQGENVNKSVATKTVKFVQSNGYYHFIETIETEEQDVPMGYKQEEGIRTLYNYATYENGTFQWTEGAAETGHYDLPEEADVFTELADIKMIADIRKEEDGSSIKYTLVLDEAFFDYAVQSSELNSYELKGYNISYLVDGNNQLHRVSLEKSEFWMQSEMYNIEQTTTYDIELTDHNQEVKMDYFATSGTYKKPVYDEITEIWREEFINVPETYILDVRVPKLKETLPNADKINQKIAVDCAMALNATVDDLISEGDWGGYPWHTVDFAVYRFADVYQICIFNTEASAWGSGIGMWMYKYYYDINLEDVVNQEDFLFNMNYTPEEIVEIFDQDYLSEMDMGGTYTYDEISDWYYFDEDANIQFYVNLFS